MNRVYTAFSTNYIIQTLVCWMHLTVTGCKCPGSLPSCWKRGGTKMERKSRYDCVRHSQIKPLLREKNITHILILLSVSSSYESTHQTTVENNAHCFWPPIMMHNLVAAQGYNTNMSGLWFGHNLHGYNSLSTGSRLSEGQAASL